MELRKPVVRWRDFTGVWLTVAALVLLLLALWRSSVLHAAAGGTTAGLTRESDGLAVERQLIPIYVELQLYRAASLVPDPSDSPARLARDINARMSNGELAGVLQQAGIGADWSRLSQMWRRASTQPFHRRAYVTLLSDYSALLQKLEDNSGISYDQERFGQDLGAETFASIPNSISRVVQISAYVERAQRARTIPLTDRLLLSNILSRASFDTAYNDVDAIVADFRHRFPESRSLALKAHGDTSRYAALASEISGRFSQLALAPVATGDPAVTRTFAQRALQTVLAYDADLATIYASELQQRGAWSRERDVLFDVQLFLGLVLVTGIVVWVAQIVKRRDLRQIVEAQRESERLAAELARKNAERALQLSEAQFRAIFEGSALGIGILNANAAVIDANDVFSAIYGEQGRSVIEGHDEEFEALMRGERELFEFEQHVMTPHGQEAWTDSTVSLVKDETGKPLFAMCMFRDLTELKRNERRMLHDMTHDWLTGLPNRMSFENTLRDAFVQRVGAPNARLAVLFVDLDRFKDINESLGHEAGDFVLSHVAQRLRGQVGTEHLVARLGSDEFAVLLTQFEGPLHVEALARRILNALAKPVALPERSLFVTASVGVALADARSERAEDVMRDADIAMRYAKGAGGSRFALFDSKMHARSEKRLQLTNDLRLALERGEFSLVYQPIVKIADGELAGCEALIRWTHPSEGAILPSEFMPLAEQTGLAIPIGRFVLRGVCEQLARWQRECALPRSFAMHVNVSAAELLDPDFEALVAQTVREYDVDPADLTLEITESVVLDSGTRPNVVLERLRELGFNVCIDDFGTGYSSLRYLQQFKVDSIKIDRSFVAAPDGDVASEPIVRTLMTLAEAFDVRVVAEGVETQRQRDVLRNAGCRFAQGFYYSKGITAGELASYYPTVFVLPAQNATA